jgi:hypothetical protein
LWTRSERGGTTHVIFEPLDVIARLAALVPKPRVNLTRFHGVFAPNSKHRARVTPAKRGRGGQRAATEDREEPPPAERCASMTWAQRLKRVFGIAIDKSAGQPICTAVGCREAVGHRDMPDETCPSCGGAVRIIACIEDAEVIEKILTHLDTKAVEPEACRLPPCRAPPHASLFD